MLNMEVNLAGIVHDSIVDGPGLRTVIFFQGCPHHCANCHNPQTHALNKKIILNLDELIAVIKTDPSIKKITISGGEPFLQYDALLQLVQALADYDIWLYTGYTKKELIKLGYSPVFKYIKVLVDGRYEEKLKTLTLPFVGSSNQKIIHFNNKK